MREEAVSIEISEFQEWLIAHQYTTVSEFEDEARGEPRPVADTLGTVIENFIDFCYTAFPGEYEKLRYPRDTLASRGCNRLYTHYRTHARPIQVLSQPAVHDTFHLLPNIVVNAMVGQDQQRVEEAKRREERMIRERGRVVEWEEDG